MTTSASNTLMRASAVNLDTLIVAERREHQALDRSQMSFSKFFDEVQNILKLKMAENAVLKKRLILAKTAKEALTVLDQKTKDEAKRLLETKRAQISEMQKRKAYLINSIEDRKKSVVTLTSSSTSFSTQLESLKTRHRALKAEQSNVNHRWTTGS